MKKKSIRKTIIITICSLLLIVIMPFTACAAEVEFYDNSAEMQATGMYGRLYIPEYEIRVALYDVTSQSAERMQTATDEVDSAAYFKVSGGAIYIADHNYQGFIGISNANVGDKAYIQQGTKTITLTCTSAGSGTNEGTYIADENGTSLSTYDGIVMYTCHYGSARSATGKRKIYYACWAIDDTLEATA